MKPRLPALALVGLLAAAGAHAAATRADRAFVAKVSQGGMFEVDAGKLAAARAGAQDVRDFAVAEVLDHTLVGAKLKAISAGQRIVIDPRPSAKFAGKMAALRSLAGAAFDRAYMSDMAALHDADGAAFAAESTGGSPAYRAFAAETHVIVQRHIGAIHGAQPPRR